MRIFLTLVTFDMLCGGALPTGDRAHACWRVHGSGNAVQQVAREVKRGAEGRKKTKVR